MSFMAHCGRFGVEQRAKLQAKATPLPHVLAMTATPIPRTLALVAHGDMALCAIDEMPPGRLPVDTTVLQDTPDELDQVNPTTIFLLLGSKKWHVEPTRPSYTPG